MSMNKVILADAHLNFGVGLILLSFHEKSKFCTFFMEYP